MTNFEAAKAEAERRGVGGYERHIFLCIGPDCCTPEQGEESWKYLKRRAAELNRSSDAATTFYRTKVGCLRICKDGPVGLVYPEGTWYAGLDSENLERVLVQHVLGGQPVEDLAIGANPFPAAPEA